MNITKKITKLDISYEQYAFFALLALVTTLLFSYAYLVNATVHSVVDRKATETHMATMHSEVSELESRYLAHIETINTTLAQDYGFQEVANVKFVTRTSATEVARAGN